MNQIPPASKKLSQSAKKSLIFGLLIALLVALPLFVWAVINLRLDIRERAQQVNIDTTNEPSKGSNNPVVTIVEFLDFQCPFCKSQADILSQIVTNYPDVKLVVKDFPLVVTHPLAMKAAISASCAYEQNKFWEMHDMIYESQEILTENSFSTFASDLLLDMSAFNDCTSNPEIEEEIQADLTEGVGILGVEGTPTLFINGIKYPGFQTYEFLSQTIESLLLAASATPTSTASTSSSPTSSGITSPTATATTIASATATPTASPTPTEAPVGGVQGEPNYCGGTCGSNYNCQPNYFCHEGYCRRPQCPTDTNCDCITESTATATTKAAIKATNRSVAIKTTLPTSKASAVLQVTPLPGSITYYQEPESTSTPATIPTFEGGYQNIPDIFKYTIGFAVGVVTTLLVSFLIKKGSQNKAKKDNIPHIVPPINI